MCACVNVYIYARIKARTERFVVQETLPMALCVSRRALLVTLPVQGVFSKRLNKAGCDGSRIMTRCTFVLLLYVLLLSCGMSRITAVCFPGEAKTYVTGDEYCGHRCIVGPTLDLGSVWQFAVFGSTGLTDTAVGSDILGDVGCHPATAIPPQTRIVGDIFMGDETAKEIKEKAQQVVNTIRSRHECVTVFALVFELSNLRLLPGIYDAGTTITREFESCCLLRNLDKSKHKILIL